VKAKINRIVEQSYLKLKESRRSYLELEVKYTEATQLLSMLIPKDGQVGGGAANVRRSQPKGVRAERRGFSPQKKP